MGMLDHWHPVCLSEQLGREPLAIQLAGRELALFRSGKGEIGALDNQCPHRRMRLSLGKVVDGKLRCKYHGWSFDTCGQGESPGTPKLTACAGNYDCREEHGAIWLKSRESDPVFPPFDNAGFLQMCTLLHHVPAPLDLTMDNFCEIEHTPTTHDVFGFPLERMQEVSISVEADDTSTRVINIGPPKVMPWWLRLLLGVKKRHVFCDDWVTYFSPCYSIYEHYFRDPQSGEEAMIRWRNYHFFWPTDDQNTAVTTFCYAKSRYPGPGGFLPPFRWLMKLMLDRELQLDVDILKGLSSYNPSLEGMKLSRFDKVLGLNRERVARVYRGEDA